MPDLRLVDLASLRERLPELRGEYAAAHPFPHTVLDGVLTPEAFRAAVAEFPAIRDPFWKGYLHVNETKYANTSPDTWGPTLTAIAQEFVSEEFVAFLTELTGIEGLMADWSMDGGGLHQTLRGGHLNVHADFTTHHTHQDWARRVNILLYLNEEWAPQWGGELELWDRDMTRMAASVAPAGNRMLIFTTGVDTYHGHPDPLTCPPDMARRSMALYYFTAGTPARRISTNYRARPQDGTKKVAIWADKVAVDAYDRVKRRLGLSDDAVQSALARVSALGDAARARRRGGGRGRRAPR